MAAYIVGNLRLTGSQKTKRKTVAKDGVSSKSDFVQMEGKSFLGTKSCHLILVSSCP